MMKTEIRTFCDTYAEKLEPFSKKLREALQAMPNGEGAPLLKQWRLRLQEVSHRAETLNDKIAQQQAFLLIFGPLKSGKSTLMNAISGSYVSEVSSLPAYPALVHVKHGEKRVFQATTYAGEKVEFESSQEMAQAVLRGHEELAQKILEVERTGESFDPQVHFTEAIRRMDVETPAEALAESGSVLVDTPGLYTRMRFGYDVMTRDFRDNASCAIFVVKSDNLFFEKVFEEFNQLLGHFSRIFLVVNIDSSKRDLNANGDLEPSLESRNPEAIVEAFQSLAMSAPLREAYDKGSLNVYTIDLLKAASRQLKQKAGRASEEEAEMAEEPAADGFDQFLGDLTDYLNSSDYLREFMHDSLRVGDNLQEEVSSVVSGEASVRLREDAEKWDRRLSESKEKIAALDALEKIDWNAAFKDVHEEKDRLLNEFSEKNSAKLGQSLSESLEKWMDTDDSLRALRDDYLNRHIERETADDAKAILERLRERLETKDGGARFSSHEARAFEKTGLRMDQMAPDLLKDLSEKEAPSSPRLELGPEDVPLKRTFLDYVLFRNNKTIRRRFFGPNGTEFIPASKKRKRIADKQLESLIEMVNDYPKKDLPQIQRDYVNRVLDAYVVQLKESLQRQCEALKAELVEQRSDCETELKSNRETQRVFERLSQSTRSFGEAVASLKEQYGTELEPVEDEAIDLEGAPSAVDAERSAEVPGEEASSEDERLSLDNVQRDGEGSQPEDDSLSLDDVQREGARDRLNGVASSSGTEPQR